MPESMRNQGRVMREQAVSMAMKRKEEYLGARVPKELRDRVIEKAKSLGIPVSILIRNILEESFKGELASAALSDGGKDKFESVLGWEKITLNRQVDCSSCGKPLVAGADVTLGLGALEPIVLCDGCRDHI